MIARKAAIRVAWSALVVLFVAGAAAARVVSEGRAELGTSDAALARGDILEATVHARAAARAYVPLAPHVAAAYGRLRSIAREAESKGDLVAALFAWRSIRAAAIGSRSFVSAHDRQRQAAEAAIARLSAAAAAGAAHGTREGAAPAHGAALDGEVPPHIGFAVLLLASVALWIAAGLRATSKEWQGGMPERGSIVMAAAGLLTSWVALFFG